MDLMTLKEAAIIVGVPIIRNIAGWAENALQDGQISKYEFAELTKTIVSMGITGTFLYFGLDGVGIDGAAIGAAVGAFIIDKITR